MTPDTNWRNAITAAVCELLTRTDGTRDTQRAKALEAACRALDAPADSAGYAWSDADVRECAAQARHAQFPAHSIEYWRDIVADWTPNTPLLFLARAALDFAAERLSAQRPAQRPAPSPRPTIEPSNDTVQYFADLLCTEYSTGNWRTAARLVLRVVQERGLVELQSAREGESPSPRPTVEQLVEIGEEAWSKRGGSYADMMEAVCRAVLAADAPAVALPEGLREDESPSDNRAEELLIAMGWRHIQTDHSDHWESPTGHPTAPPIPDALREKARKIAEQFPSEEALKRFCDPLIQAAFALVRELAAQP